MKKAAYGVSRYAAFFDVSPASSYIAQLLFLKRLQPLRHISRGWIYRFPRSCNGEYEVHQFGKLANQYFHKMKSLRQCKEIKKHPSGEDGCWMSELLSSL